MTASLNRVQLIGNLGADPKGIAGKEGQSFVTATLATNESFKQNDEWQTRVEWHQLMNPVTKPQKSTWLRCVKCCNQIQKKFRFNHTLPREQAPVWDCSIHIRR